MNCTSRVTLRLFQRVAKSRTAAAATASNSSIRSFSSLPPSIERVGETLVFPNEYPGQNYEFNWTLNADGVTPIQKSAFRIAKPLDLKIAGLTPLPKSKTPLQIKVKAKTKKSIQEAGSDALDFDTYDEVSQRTKDVLSLSPSLYCPEGHMPKTTTTVRVITNSATIAPQMVAYLDRAPKKQESTGCSITAYVLEDESIADTNFSAYAIEEVADGKEVKSVAAVVCTGKTVDVEAVVAGLELSLEGMLEDEEARKKEAEEAAAAAEKEE